MGDFEIFLKSVHDGNFEEVMNNFQIDFLERMTNDKRRPIHLACQNGHLEIVKFLIENNCNIECEDENKWRPIHLACQNGHLDIVKFLLENNCNIECEDEDMWRPIHNACAKGQLEIVKFLLENNCNIECENLYKWRPIHLACQNGNIEILKCLLQNNSELDYRTNAGETPMEIAKKSGHKCCTDFLNEILERRKIFDCIRRNDAQALSAVYHPGILMMEEQESGLSLLEVALKFNANEIIDYFLNKTLNVEEISPLKDYVENCSRPDAVQLIQECLLYQSIRFHDADGFHMFCLAKTINERRQLAKSSFLEIAAEYGCNAFINLLLKKSIYNEEEWAKAKDLAILKKHDEIAEAISNRKILLSKRADKNFTWLHSAVSDNDPDMLKYILDRNLVNPNSNNEVVGTGLALSHMMCYDKCIEVLEKFNVDINTQNKYSQSPLHEAIASGMINHCSYLISRAEDIDKPGFMGFTGLHCAVIEGCEDLCDELVKNCADCFRYVEILHQSSLNKAVLPISKIENAVTLCMKIHETIYPCFLEVLGSDIVKCSDGDGNSLLHMAVKSLQPDLCNTLIKSGTNVEAINNDGNSALFELFSNVENRQINDNVEKAIAILNIFVESGIDINKISKCGITVFQGASQWNSERMMVSILTKKPQVTCLTEKDFKMAFTKHWFEYATTLISLMSEDFLQSIITNEIFNLAMPHDGPILLMSLFVKSNPKVQQLVIEDLLDHFAIVNQ